LEPAGKGGKGGLDWREMVLFTSIALIPCGEQQEIVPENHCDFMNDDEN